MIVLHREAEQKLQRQSRAAAGEESIVAKLIEISRDPGVDVAKINALIDANERIITISARRAFDDAYAAMQGELPIITKRGMVVVTKKDEPGTVLRRTPYARGVDITKVVRPILAKYGFSIRHRNVVESGKLTVVGILAHRAGHREEDTFGPVDRDDTGHKNLIQSWGSARQYGKRYTTIALLGIDSEDPNDGDDDGQAAGEMDPSRGPQPGSSTRKGEELHRARTEGDSRPISRGSKQQPGQLERLWTIIRNSGRNEQTIRDWLFDKYGYTSSRDIQRKDYDEICKAIEAPGALPPSIVREPGQEG
jgi:hypothetical protein